MKKQLSLILLLTIMPLVVACSDHEDEIVDVSSYIIGKWHTTTCEYYGNGKKVTLPITKTGEMSAAYFEFYFHTNGTVTLSCWKSENNGLTQWVDEKGTYKIKGDVVAITDDSGDTSDLLFDGKQRTLCMHFLYNSNGTPITTNLYLKK